MKVYFGLKWDTGAWPEFDEGRGAISGEVFTGPQGLVSLLETYLGLSGVVQPDALRIRRYMEALNDVDQPGAFYANSLKADAWATARTLLSMRDDLVLHGWNGIATNDAPSRIADLAHIESKAQIEPGLADRLREVLGLLQEKPRIPVHELVVADPLELLPLPWKALLRSLDACGVRISQRETKTAIPEQIVLLESERPWLIAQGVACWLQGMVSDADMVMLCSGDTTLLDQALHHQHLPATGQTESSAYIGLYQLLPLALENIWAPVRIARLMELLSVPYSPVPRFAAQRLIQALSKEPGLEGMKWREALEDIARDKAAFLKSDGIEEAKAIQRGRKFAEELDQWLRASRVDESQPADAAVVVGVVERLMRHLGGLSEVLPEARVAVGYCRDMLQILSTIREIDRALLENIVDDVVGPSRSSTTRREAAPWGVISHPAQLAAPVDTLVWWNFCDNTASSRYVWSRKERQWLEAHGVVLDTVERERALERAHWLNALGQSRQVLFCRPLQIEGDPVPVHPLWFEVEAEDSLKERVTILKAEDFFAGKAVNLLGSGLGLQPAKQRSVSSHPAYRKIPSSDCRTEKLSPTALGNMFGCPFKWLVEHLGIKPSDVMSFPEESVLIGTLAHQVLEDVFSEAPIPSEAEARKRAETSFEKRVPEMAAELMVSEKLADRNDVRDRIITAAADLAGLFSEAGFERLECEKRIETQLDGIPVKGRADLIAYKAGGQACIIDFKYSSSGFYRKKIESGTDLQLVAYARMLEQKQTPVAYYLVPKQEMVTMFPDFGVPTVEPQVPIEEGWNRVRKTYASTIKTIREGEVLAAGLLNDAELKGRADQCQEKGEIFLDPPCQFCDLGALCGLKTGGKSNG